MLKLLVKKQLFEIFRSYFYDAKKNKARTKGATIGYIDRDGAPIDNDGRQDHDAGVHQAHEVDPEQARSHQRPHRNGEREQQVVVLCGIQPRVGVEHAAERAEKDRHQAHDRKVEPAHPCLRERRTKCNAHHREHSADDDDHHKGEKHDISDDCVF